MPVERNSVRTALERYKNRIDYQGSAFPFPPRRMSLFDKLHRDFVVLISLIGLIWLTVKLVGYALS